MVAGTVRTLSFVQAFPDTSIAYRYSLGDTE
jgi:hypothetical protein